MHIPRSTQLFADYHEQVKSGRGAGLRRRLESDPRVKSLAGKMISHGSGAVVFQLDRLIAWHLWCADNKGDEEAATALEDFLNEDTVEVLATLWVGGLTVDDQIALPTGHVIIPVDKMPDNDDKERYLGLRFAFQIPFSPTSHCAITKIIRTEKIQPAIIPGRPQPLALSRFHTESEALDDIALLINVLPGLWSVPYYSTSYPTELTPFGPFSGTGGGGPVHDIMTNTLATAGRDSFTGINLLLESYQKMDAAKKTRIRQVLTRLSQAKRRQQMEDKLLDLGIALEMLLLQGNKLNQLSFTFRMRGSWLVGRTAEDRVRVHKLLKEIYEHRSAVAHSGQLNGSTAKRNPVRAAFFEYQSLAEEIAQTIILNGAPDWDALVLNAS